MTKEDFKQLFVKQIEDWDRRIKVSDYFEDIQKIPQVLHYLLISEYSLENVTMEMKSIDAANLQNFDCSKLENFNSDQLTHSIIPHLIEK